MGSPRTKCHLVYALVGKERWLRREAIDNVLHALHEEMGEVTPVRFEGDRAELADVLDEVRTPSLLGGLRAVIVDDAEDFISKYRSALESYCANPSDTGCLIFDCDSLPKNTRLYKAVAEKGEVISCEPLKGRALVSWITQRAGKAYGKQLSDAVATQLRDHLGDSLGLLDAELGKLAAYVGQRAEITTDDVRKVTGQLREETVFAVTDAIASGQTAAALRLWEQVLATDRAAQGRSIAGLAWAIRRLLETRRAWDGGASLRTLAPKLFVEPSVLEARLSRCTARQLERQLQDLLEADEAIKTGKSTIEVAIERFIVKHAGARQAASPERLVARG